MKKILILTLSPIMNFVDYQQKVAEILSQNHENLEIKHCLIRGLDIPTESDGFDKIMFTEDVDSTTISRIQKRIGENKKIVRIYPTIYGASPIEGVPIMTTLEAAGNFFFKE